MNISKEKLEQIKPPQSLDQADEKVHQIENRLENLSRAVEQLDLAGYEIQVLADTLAEVRAILRQRWSKALDQCVGSLSDYEKAVALDEVNNQLRSHDRPESEQVSETPQTPRPPKDE